MIGDPYREAPRQPRYVCLSCETREAWPGLCPKCEVERLPLGDSRVRDELDAARERRLQTRAGREQRLAAVGSFLVAAPLASLGGWPIGMLAWFGGAMAGTLVMWRLIALCRGSALHVFFLRRRAISTD